MPLPTIFVVKNGSNTRGSASGGMPGPSSITSAYTTSPSALTRVRSDDAALRLRLQDRLLGVQQQVQEHLLELLRVAGDRRQRRARTPSPR